VAKKKRGIYEDPTGTATAQLEDKVADYSYSSDALAQLIVDMWLGNHNNLTAPFGPGTTKAQYLARSAAAKTVLADRGIYLQKPIVISEDEYEAGFKLADAGLLDSGENIGVVFVLPRDSRPTLGAAPPPPPPLLETAKMLMAITPNGI